MRVGIITIHYVDNIGGTLLAYSLQEAIGRLGYDAEIIDYDPTPIPARAEFVRSQWARRLRAVPSLMRHPRLVRDRLGRAGLALPSRHPHGSIGPRHEAFRSFQDRHFKLSTRHYTSAAELEADPPQLDAAVCGSDQIWNPFMVRNGLAPANDRAYFLTFMPPERRVSYAPSVAVPSIPPGLYDEMTRLVSGIPHLSCRESQGSALIAKMAGRRAPVVADPTLLLTGEDWRRVAKGASRSRPYVFCYFLGEGQEYRDYARRVAAENDLELVVVSRDLRDGQMSGATSLPGTGPSEFLRLVDDAELVLTDSYHGTLFSLNLETPFWSFERPGSHGSKSMSSRISSILEKVGLPERLLTDYPEPKLAASHLDFTDARSRLAEFRSTSMAYLQSALADATQSR